MAFEVERDACQWINRDEVLKHFAVYAGSTQSAKHIKPLHWYIACRLVVEGGFDPDDITPRPPFKVKVVKGWRLLEYVPGAGKGGERSILGGLKTKKVDVVVNKNGIGPVLAISCKGVTGALRNLTNRMEETIGECTNLHITYNALVVGYLAIIRANPFEWANGGEARLEKNDVVIGPNGRPVSTIVRFDAALRQLTGRQGIRNDVSRYESIGLGLVDVVEGHVGELLDTFPEPASPLHFERFFETLYRRYDERYVLSAPDLASVTRRHIWDEESRAFADGNGGPELDYEPRVTTGAEDDAEIDDLTEA